AGPIRTPRERDGFPSGDHAGWIQRAGELVTRSRCSESAAFTYRSNLPADAASPFQAKARRVPSGENAGARSSPASAVYGTSRPGAAAESDRRTNCHAAIASTTAISSNAGTSSARDRGPGSGRGSVVSAGAGSGGAGGGAVAVAGAGSADVGLVSGVNAPMNRYPRRGSVSM